jgi:heptosyltransferase-3
LSGAAASESVLVYMLGSLGDTIVTIPSLRAVVRAAGDPARVVVLHDRVAEGLAGPREILPGSLGITRFLDYPAGARRGLGDLLMRLRAERIRTAVYLAPGERSRAQILRDSVFFRLAGARELIGFRRAADPSPRSSSSATPAHEALLRLDRLARDGVHVDPASDLATPLFVIDPETSDSALAWLRARRAFPERALLAICPGAKQPANLWTLDRFREVGDELRRSGDVELVIVGGPAEAEMGRRLTEAWGEGINAAGELSALQSAALLRQARVAIGLDTGTTHLAAAVGTPCVGVYGGREPIGRWEPLGSGHVVLRHPVSCSPCGYRSCPIPGHPCMSAHRVAEVVRAARRILSRHPAAAAS